MSELVSYALADGVATIAMDDGKANVFSPEMLDELHGALDRAESDGAVVVLTGRARILSAGFDLATLTAGGQRAVDMVHRGFLTAERLLSFPAPVVIACPGHAVAMGVFLLLSADHRVGADGAFRYQANEVAIGLTMPRAAIAICRQRLIPSDLDRAVLLSASYTPVEGLRAGFVDQLVPADDVLGVAQQAAQSFTTLNRNAHTTSKRRLRALLLAELREAIEADHAELVGLPGVAGDGESTDD